MITIRPFDQIMDDASRVLSGLAVAYVNRESIGQYKCPETGRQVIGVLDDCDSVEEFDLESIEEALMMMKSVPSCSSADDL